jgi:uncharacterized protein (TIGR02246 family)
MRRWRTRAMDPGIVLACLWLGAVPAVAQQSDESRIRGLDDAWVQKIQEGDVDWIVDLYAEDGRFLPPGRQPAVGRDAIRDAWASIIDVPLLVFAPDIVRVSASGDVAYDIGTYGMRTVDVNGRTALDHGKYLRVWVKRGGRWRVEADIFNSDLPTRER